MDVDRIVTELREKAEQPFRPCPLTTPDDLMQWGIDDETLNNMLDAVSLRVARCYAAGELTFEIADAIVNELYHLPIAYSARTENFWPPLFWEVYLAFDSGEFHRTRDRSDDPIADHTDPAIQALILRLPPERLAPLSPSEPTATSAGDAAPRPLRPPPRRRDRYRGRRGPDRG